VEGIKIPIGAPLGQLGKDLNDAKRALKGFSVDASGNLLSVGKSLGVLERQHKVFKEGIKNSTDPSRIITLTNAMKSAEAQILNANKAINGATLGRLTTGSNSAATALQNLGRVAQDAPFGFIGIQNNLNPLLESFGRLKAETGSTGSALKALAGSLIGPAGLGVALSLVSAGILLYQEYARGAKKETKELASATDEMANSASNEIAKVTLLYDASQNLNIPLQERKKIVDELQRQFPTTFGNLSDEAILAGKAKTAYDGLTQSIINSAVVRGGEDIIAAKVKVLAASLLAFEDQQRKLSEQTGGKGFLAKNNAFNVDENGDLETLSNYETRIKKEISDVRKSIQGVISNFSAESIIGNIGGDAPKSDGSKTPKKDIPKFDRGAIFSEAKMVGVTMGVGLQAGFQTVQPILAEQFELLNKQFIDWNRNISDIVNNGLVQTLGGIGEAIGQSLASGSSIAQNLGATLLASLGSVLGQLGQMAIATGVALLGIQTALKTLNPFAAIAAGVALLALSGIVRGGASRLSGGFSGGGGGGGYSAASPSGGVSPVSSSGSMGGGFSGAELVARVSGSDLLLVINRAQAKNRRFGP